MKLNKSEKKVLRAIRDKTYIQKGKHGRYPLNIQKATVLLMNKNLIHLCDENHWCISDLDKVNSLIGDEFYDLRQKALAAIEKDGPHAAPKISSGDDLLDRAIKVALKHKKHGKGI